MADTEFLRYECAVLGQQGREDYLMDAQPSAAYRAHPEADFDCPFWQELEP